MAIKREELEPASLENDATDLAQLLLDIYLEDNTDDTVSTEISGNKEEEDD